MKIRKIDYKISSDKIPESFDGFKITQISDVHNIRLNDDFYKLIDGDIIVITGDLTSHNDSNLSCIETLRRLSDIAQVYYITGNHEGGSAEFFSQIESIIDKRVRILHDEMVSVEKNGESISLIGLDDLKYLETVYGRDKNIPDDRLKNFQTDNYTVVLLHSPTNIEHISQYKPNLVLCGHTHGGQICLPKFGAIYAPGQGFFPKYKKGLYHIDNTDVIISAGIGYSRLNVRIFCPSEFNTITLRRKPIV